MEGMYPILHGEQKVGQAQITRRGLYYHFACRLQLTEKRVCRLEVSCGNNTENLGVPVPEGNTFVLNKVIPISRLKEGTPIIRIAQKHDSKEIFVPINPDEPFAYLSQLKDARLQRRGDQLGIVIKE